MATSNTGMEQTNFGILYIFFLLTLQFLGSEAGCLYGRPCFGIMCAIGCTTPTKYHNAIPVERCDHYPVGSKVMYRCDDDSYPGTFITTCKQDGSWQKPPFQCRAIECGKLRGQKLDTTYIIDRSHGTKHRATVRISCRHNKAISCRAFCNNRGKWVYDLPQCPVSTRSTSRATTTYTVTSTALPEVVKPNNSSLEPVMFLLINQAPSRINLLNSTPAFLTSNESPSSNSDVYSATGEVTTSSSLPVFREELSENKNDSPLVDKIRLTIEENNPSSTASSAQYCLDDDIYIFIMCNFAFFWYIAHLSFSI